VTFKSSRVHGTGVFAKQPIPAGARVWEYDASMKVFDRFALATLDPGQLAYVLHCGYLHTPSHRFLWCEDGMQFMNHAAPPLANTGLGYWPELRQDHSIALRNIAAGEELFEDYTFWSDSGIAPDHWLYPLYRDHSPEHLAFLSAIRAQPAVAA
jgi:hypothetical protein